MADTTQAAPPAEEPKRGDKEPDKKFGPEKFFKWGLSAGVLAALGFAGRNAVRVLRIWATLLRKSAAKEYDFVQWVWEHRLLIGVTFGFWAAVAVVLQFSGVAFATWSTAPVWKETVSRFLCIAAAFVVMLLALTASSVGHFLRGWASLTAAGVTKPLAGLLEVLAEFARKMDAIERKPDGSVTVIEEKRKELDQAIAAKIDFLHLLLLTWSWWCVFLAYGWSFLLGLGLVVGGAAVFAQAKAFRFASGFAKRLIYGLTKVSLAVWAAAIGYAVLMPYLGGVAVAYFPETFRWVSENKTLFDGLILPALKDIAAILSGEGWNPAVYRWVRRLVFLAFGLTFLVFTVWKFGRAIPRLTARVFQSKTEAEEATDDLEDGLDRAQERRLRRELRERRALAVFAAAPADAVQPAFRPVKYEPSRPWFARAVRWLAMAAVCCLVVYFVWTPVKKFFTGNTMADKTTSTATAVAASPPSAAAKTASNSPKPVPTRVVENGKKAPDCEDVLRTAPGSLEAIPCRTAKARREHPFSDDPPEWSR